MDLINNKMVDSMVILHLKYPWSQWKCLDFSVKERRLLKRELMDLGKLQAIVILIDYDHLKIPLDKN